MPAKVSRTVKKVLGQDEKRIEDVVPEMVRIMAEGDVLYRVANYLVSQGWTSMDIWRELTQKRGWSGWFTTNLQNDMRDAERTGSALASRSSSKYGDEISGLKQIVKMKR